MRLANELVLENEASLKGQMEPLNSVPQETSPYINLTRLLEIKIELEEKRQENKDLHARTNKIIPSQATPQAGHVVELIEEVDVIPEKKNEPKRIEYVVEGVLHHKAWAEA